MFFDEAEDPSGATCKIEGSVNGLLSRLDDAFKDRLLQIPKGPGRGGGVTKFLVVGRCNGFAAMAGPIISAFLHYLLLVARFGGPMARTLPGLLDARGNLYGLC